MSRFCATHATRQLAGGQPAAHASTCQLSLNRIRAPPPFSLLQEGSEPLTPRSEASDVSGMSAEAQAYLERHLAIVARGRGGLVPAHVQKQLGACNVWGCCC